MKILIPLVLAISVVFVSGCTQTYDITQVVKQTQEAKDFLAAYPNANVTAVRLSNDTVASTIGEIRGACDASVPVKPYWKIRFLDANTSTELTGWVDAETQELVCFTKTGQKNENNATTPDNAPIIPTRKSCRELNGHLCSSEGQCNTSWLNSSDSYCCQVPCNTIIFSNVNPPTCTEDWSCGSWSDCADGLQTRACIDSNGCGSFVNKSQTTQTCTSSCTEAWQCSTWSSCENGEQTRTCSDMNNCGSISSKPPIIQTCTVMCSSFTYSDWGVCSSSGTQTRTVVSSSPSGCMGGNPVLSQICTPIPPCTPTWSCTGWSYCIDGTQNRICTDSNNCGTIINKPIESQSCKSECPDLSSNTVNITDYIGFGGVSFYNGSIQIPGKNIDGWKFFWAPSLYLGPNKDSVACRKGTNEGENINYYYCVSYIGKILLDDKGNIIDKQVKLITGIFDSSGNYLRAVCKRIGDAGLEAILSSLYQTT